ncbi:hypothetical protein MTsPCn5_08770 [Croceitalea sp. MTPC5]|jgi:murein DD-endopeptidase MepM/ murein hydrolase activator NlpD|uniref:M23 family peptidase n=3 Tax=Flagellimonas TaxID=444459 RepID=A0A371JVG6_9FLAO|nr:MULTISPECIES: M23 family metallopeptidase [Allomuricauda]GMN05489.1 hypothetical protein MTsPCn5_08770 [Croceitalea sp. MTPC5]MBO0340739.1 M23 family metallopeptidase [Allomuricauda profundi]MBW8241678.1 M23 family metallopeptidase [Allomuricauda oceani]QII44337.1 M23 family metallopeptidase [Allomuricauda oceani]RDY61807.1 M23 family peptidase [Allomuricauda nanhaiensis]|tara:strand:- start:14310 stop:15149 length:840 start_codon:yes stop_codon:yes gene_type:complete
MNFFEFTTFRTKNIILGIWECLKQLGRKELAYLLLLTLVCLVYFVQGDHKMSETRLHDATVAMAQYQERLKLNINSDYGDSLTVQKEREQLLMAIEERIVTYLYQIPDYSYIGSLETYLKCRHVLLEQLPSAVPLEKGDYILSSDYGIRSHPISGKTKKHFGIDLAASNGKPVYASASGIITDIFYSDKGYGTHIIIKHRFGFQTLYGHLDKVLAHKGQKVEQHELIATVGSSGSSTGYHLHYETIKNQVKIDPRPSLALKKKIYEHVIQINPNKDGEE